MMAATLKFKSNESDADAVETSMSLLRSMRDDGNVPANDYYEQLVQLRCDLNHAREQMRGAIEGSQNGATESNGLQLLLAASGSFNDAGPSTPGATRTDTTFGEGIPFGAPGDFDTGAALDDPFLQDFLAQKQPYTPWAPDSIGPFPTGDPNGQWNFDWEDANLFGNI